MTAQEKLSGLKVDLGISTTAYDSRLSNYISHAEAEIRREGITLSDGVSDGELVIMYAAWLWRKRDTGAGMPRMLRYALNNRLFAEKMNSGGKEDVTPDAYVTVDQLSAAISAAQSDTLATVNETAATKEELTEAISDVTESAATKTELAEAVADVLEAVNDSALTVKEVTLNG